jgi:pyridoxine 5-phosphate synthase
MKLSVNLNKVALLRNSRGGSVPSPLIAAEACLDAGAPGITLHWRADSRHARPNDVREIAALCRKRNAEFNLEGDPRPDLLALAEQVVPTQLTLVPVRPGELTSDHGWNLPAAAGQLAPVVARCQRAGMRVSVFVESRAEVAEAARATGADRIEIYTEPYAAAFAAGASERALGQVVATVAAATRAGLGVNAGHDLNLHNLPPLARAAPAILEVSIGHALIAESLYLGLRETVTRYLRACQGQPVDAPLP